MSSKKQKAKDQNVLLGFPDGKIDADYDNDAYVTKIGGLPIWLDSNSLPSIQACTCKICKKSMYLIFQSYVPLPDSPYHRVLYVWACNKRSCMRKEGSFSVLRSHMVDPVFLKAQKQKEEEKRKREEKKKQQIAAQTKSQQNFQLGDLWGSGAGSFGTSAATTGFGMAKEKTLDNPFSNNNNNSSGFGTTSTQNSFAAIAKKNVPSNTTTDLLDKLTQLHIDDPIQTTLLPYFPGHYLYIDQEKLDQYEHLGIDMSRYQQYLDIEKQLLDNMDVDNTGAPGEIWEGETYEKQQLPRGVDKHFKKFTERVECAPNQCVRYEFEGRPLLYNSSALGPELQKQMTASCKYCGGPRVFEFQLMPTILSLLPTIEYATKEEEKKREDSHSNSSHNGTSQKALLDSWNVGMEFGTVLVFTCQKDCHPGNMEDIAYMEEVVIVQYETD